MFGMCLSSTSTRAIIHKLRMDHDSSILAWREDVKKNHVSIFE